MGAWGEEGADVCFSGMDFAWTGVCCGLWVLWWDSTEEEMDPRSNTSLRTPESERSPDPDPDRWDEDE